MSRGPNGGGGAMAIDHVILSVLAKVGGGVPATKLVKLVYLVDYIHYQHFGETVTGLEYQWDHYGPNAVQHGIVSAAEGLALKKQIAFKAIDNAYGSVTKYFRSIPDTETPTLDAKAEMVMSDVVNCYGKLSVERDCGSQQENQPVQEGIAVRYVDHGTTSTCSNRYSRGC